MKTLSVYTRSGDVCPSSYYRILQYAEKLDCKIKYRAGIPNEIFSKYNKTKGIKRKFYQIKVFSGAYLRIIRFFIADIIKKPDVLFVQRAIMLRVFPFPLSFLMKKMIKNIDNVIWDIDDNIFECGEISNAEKNILLAKSNHIIVIGDYLKSLIPDEYKDKVTFLPTTDGDYRFENVDKLSIQRKKEYNEDRVRFLWLATWTSLPFLEDIVPYMDRAAKIVKEEYGKEIILEVVCNRPLLSQTENFKIINYNWTKELAKEKMFEANVGLMPTRYNPFTLGKGGFKMIQYMSVGLPTLASAVGYTNEVMVDGETGISISYENLEEWEKAIVEICSSWGKMDSMGRKARKRWEAAFSYDENLNKLYKLINEKN